MKPTVKTDKYEIKKITEDMPIPAEMESGVMYFNHGTVGFLCPSGCGEALYLPVTTDGIKTPARWLLSISEDVPTLSPSMQRRSYCKCQSHFFITNGKVVWC